MRLIASALLLAIGLAGCASQSSPYGNFVVAEPALNQPVIANDAVQQLVTLYPPAKTRLELQQPNPDPFGQALVKGLRAKGYSILEFDPQAPATQTKGGLPLKYVFDRAQGMDLYLVTIMVGDRSITRPYVEKDGKAMPAGYWVRKE